MIEKYQADVYDLIYKNQVIELDCMGIYLQTGFVGKNDFSEGKRSESVSPTVNGGDESTGISKRISNLPAFLCGKVFFVSEREFTTNFARIPDDLWNLLSSYITIPLFIIDPKGVFSIETRLINKSQNPASLTTTRPHLGMQIFGRRFVRVQVLGTVTIINMELGEASEPNPILDIGGGGIRVLSRLGWLKVGDEVHLHITAGFRDKENIFISLELTVPSRVVWTKKLGIQEGRMLYQIGFAFTDISISDQDRLISFLISAERSNNK